MLKIKDKNGKTVMVLKDDANEPEVSEEIKAETQEEVEETQEGESDDDVE